VTVEAERSGFWRARYAISIDGTPVTTFDSAMWRSGGRFALRGRDYVVTSSRMGHHYALAESDSTGTADGPVVAVADRVGRKNWTVTAEGTEYSFRRASMLRGDQELLGADGPVGRIAQRSMWKGGAVAELPGLPTAVQVFVVAVVLSMWASQSAAAGASAGG
jgi:hypothetical protein